MKVVILAGGKGTRLLEFTKKIPKPMVPVKKKPILIHIMSHYAKYGFKNFIIATGFKHEIIKNFFKKKISNWDIQIINTGLNSMTGGRVRRLKKIIGEEKFFLTYGDGISNVNLKRLLNFHNSSKAAATLTAVRPPARFGAIKIKGRNVSVFREKSSLDTGWINGGFFVFEPQIFKYLKSDKTILEKEPLTTLGKKKKIVCI
jgi:glucose-1-phosphate cytidylyltransferase